MSNGHESAHKSASGITMFDQVPDIPDGEPLAREWKAFRREVGKLMDKGETGRFAVFKGDSLVGIWDTLADADQAGRLQCAPGPFLVQEIQLYLRPMHWGYSRPCSG
jgi:hypothetical protein